MCDCVYMESYIPGWNEIKYTLAQSCWLFAIGIDVVVVVVVDIVAAVVARKNCIRFLFGHRFDFYPFILFAHFFICFCSLTRPFRLPLTQCLAHSTLSTHTLPSTSINFISTSHCNILLQPQQSKSKSNRCNATCGGAKWLGMRDEMRWVWECVCACERWWEKDMRIVFWFGFVLQPFTRSSICHCRCLPHSVHLNLVYIHLIWSICMLRYRQSQLPPHVFHSLSIWFGDLRGRMNRFADKNSFGRLSIRTRQKKLMRMRRTGLLLIWVIIESTSCRWSNWTSINDTTQRSDQ